MRNVGKSVTLQDNPEFQPRNLSCPERSRLANQAAYLLTRERRNSRQKNKTSKRKTL